MPTMLCVPAGSAVVVQYAFFVVPFPTRILAEQPGIDVPSLVKFTVPFGIELAFTLAENVTLAPTVDGLSELPTKVSVDWANAFAENTRASEARTLAAIRSERSLKVRGVAIETARPAIDDARIGFNLALLWKGIRLHGSDRGPGAHRSAGAPCSMA